MVLRRSIGFVMGTDLSFISACVGLSHFSARLSDFAATDPTFDKVS
jgi:hypothetical protein